MPAYPHPDTLTELTTARPDSPVVSLYLDTDPRKPENNSDTPAWLVELRNGLREVGEAIEAEGDRDTVLAWRDVSDEIEAEIRELTPAQRGRSLALFRTVDGSYSHRVTSQLSLEASQARWDAHPYIAPLVELLDRGRPVAVVLIDNDEMSVLRWWDGRIVDGTETGVESDLDAWRSARGGSEGGHLPRLRTHEQQVEARSDEHSRRFLADAAAQLAQALPDLEAESIVIAHAPGSLTPFVEALPADVADRVVKTIEAQITGEDAASVGERLADDLAEVARTRGAKVAADALAAAAMTDGNGVSGADAVLRALAEHRVDRLAITPDLTLGPGDVGAEAASFLKGVDEDLLVERVLEQAAETGASVTVVEDEELARAGGIAALTRW